MLGRARLCAAVAACLLAIIMLPPEPAQADAGCSGKLFGCVATAKKKVVTVRRVVQADTGAKQNYRLSWNGPQTSDFNAFRKTASKGPADASGCAGLDGGEACVVVLDTDPAPPGNVTVVTITAYQAALMAAAYLPLQPGKPTVGPPPTLNKWKMAAVGYPLWIWAEGNLDPAPVTRSVSGISVSLDASLPKIVYDLGDGTTITCGPGTPWRKGSVPAGTPSPDCGHTYAKPSLPKGSYTITATTHWSVAWTAGGQSGTIPFTQTSSTTLPVGEVQTLVR